MKMYLPFGDWSGDGHGQYTKVLIDAPSMEIIRLAQKRIEEYCGEGIWEGFAKRYQEDSISDTIQELLINTNYPIERLAKCQDDCGFDDFKNLNECFNSDFWNDSGHYITLETCIDTFIWLLNAHGARIKRLDETENIPTISNWTCPGFKTVGYGCFDL